MLAFIAKFLIVNSILGLIFSFVLLFEPKTKPSDLIWGVIGAMVLLALVIFKALKMLKKEREAGMIEEIEE